MVALNQGPVTAPFLLSHKGTFLRSYPWLQLMLGVRGYSQAAPPWQFVVYTSLSVFQPEGTQQS